MSSPAFSRESERALRAAEERDIPALAVLWAECFPGRKGVEERVRELQHGMAWGGLADCRLVESPGRIVAALRAYRMELNFGGRAYPTLGLAGVAVAPDFRRRGLGRGICVEAMAEARARGAALSLLYPFRASFYEDLGYTFAGELQHYRFRPSDLPLHEGWDRVERLHVDPADALRTASETAETRALHARVAARSNGMLTRPRRVWRSMLDEPVRLYAYRARDEVVRGYALVSEGKPRPTLRIRELVWEDDAAYLALLGWIAAQRDQYAFVRYDALPSEAFHRRVPHPRASNARRPRGLWFESARVFRGPMLRVLNPGALQDASSLEELRVADPDLPENSGVWRAGRRVEDVSTAMSPAEATRALLASRLPGQALPPPDWRPIAGAEDFRVLDEF